MSKRLTLVASIAVLSVVSACGESSSGLSEVIESFPEPPGTFKVEVERSVPGEPPIAEPPGSEAPEDEWVQAVRGADSPLAVAYGLTDDADALSAALYRAQEVKTAACMNDLGLAFEIEYGERADAAAEANAETQSSLPPDQAEKWNENYEACVQSSAAQIFITNAYPEFTENIGELEQAAGGTAEDARQAEAEWLIANRDKVEILAQNLQDTL